MNQNFVMLLDDEGRLDFFQSDDVDDLHDCIEQYDDCIYFYASIAPMEEEEIIPLEYKDAVEVQAWLYTENDGFEGAYMLGIVKDELGYVVEWNLQEMANNPDRIFFFMHMTKTTHTTDIFND